jgi:hypothetical protein
MKNLRLITTLALAFAFLFAQVGNVAAAPLAQAETPITGNIVSIEPQMDGTTVLVTLEGGQTVLISVATAAGLGLLVVDENGEPVLDPVTNLPTADESQVGQPVEILPGDVILDETPEEEEPVHLISALLADFFDVDASLIDSYHNGDNEDGVFGFGVIAQALWMSQNVDGEISFEDILQAKKDGSGEFTLSDGTVITYTNWGQLKKALLEKHNSLGSAKHAEEDENSSQSLQGNGQGNGQGNNKGKGNGKGKGHNKP